MVIQRSTVPSPIERIAPLLAETPERELRSVVKLLSKMNESRVEPLR